MKFKVGDHITITYAGHPSSGKSGIVTGILDYAYEIKFDDTEETQHWSKYDPFFEYFYIHHSPLYNELK